MRHFIKPRQVKTCPAQGYQLLSVCVLISRFYLHPILASQCCSHAHKEIRHVYVPFIYVPFIYVAVVDVSRSLRSVYMRTYLFTPFTHISQEKHASFVFSLRICVVSPLGGGNDIKTYKV